MNEPLRLEPAIAALQRIHQMAGSRRDSLVLHLMTTSPGAIGGRPGTGITSFQEGFDWDAGKVLMAPAEPLTRLTPDDVAAIKESVRGGGSWHAYQAQKRLRERIRELEAEVAALKVRP